jgi:hypothetical protein
MMFKVRRCWSTINNLIDEITLNTTDKGELVHIYLFRYINIQVYFVVINQNVIH